MSKRELRLYPSCCTSAYCGSCEPACRTCDNREVKDEFTRWRKATAAVCEDPIWCPRVYVATQPDGRAA